MSEENPLLSAYLERRADLKRVFAARLGSPDPAEDLLQDIYIKVAALDHTETIDNPMAYLYRLGSNLMLDHLKAKKRASARDGAWTQATTTAIGGVEIAEQPIAEEAFTAKQRLGKIAAALTELSPQAQQIFRLHKLEGLGQAEVAARVGLSRSAVEKHVSAVLKHLMARLER